MARARKAEEERSMDSLMDAMTNVVGILLLILIVSSLGISAAVKKVIDDGLRTGDIFSGAPGTRKVNTKEIGDAVIAAL